MLHLIIYFIVLTTRIAVRKVRGYNTALKTHSLIALKSYMLLFTKGSRSAKDLLLRSFLRSKSGT